MQLPIVRGRGCGSLACALSLFVLAPLALASSLDSVSLRWGSAALDAGNQSSSSTSSPALLLPQLELRGSTSTIFAQLVREAGLSGGIATSEEGCLRAPEQAISVAGETKFESAAAQIAKTSTGTGLRRQDGVADLFPSGMVPHLLAMRVSFDWDDATPVREIVDRLRQLPDVAGEAIRLGLREAPIEGASTSLCIRNCSEAPTSVPVPQTANQLPLLTVLNRIVLGHKGTVWNYEEHQCRGARLFSITVIGQ